MSIGRFAIGRVCIFIDVIFYQTFLYRWFRKATSFFHIERFHRIHSSHIVELIRVDAGRISGIHYFEYLH